ncbi:unnamed protein product [Litomosoides sigmodontis]|uniref:Uncharacterized protein n=1 Tax=Litomosoides sigmodontis TaxID=42156 RepID=A0A3P6TUR0_LITSI|nr:unnamed protein product [Litomosoides sigmodontis]
MNDWNSFMLTTREWIVVLYAVIIVFIIISIATLTVCTVRNCCYVIFTSDEEVSRRSGRISTDELTRITQKTYVPNADAERDAIIRVAQQSPLTGQSFRTENSPVNRIDEACPIHGREKYHNNVELQKNNLLMDGGRTTPVNQ